jgi:hypothetical protein
MNQPQINLSSLQPVITSIAGVRDIAPALLDDLGFLRVAPAAFFADTTVQERALFGNRHGLYGFLTTELIQWLQERINGRKAIEIGSGNGSLAYALDIPATDSKMQDNPEVAKLYATIGAPVVKYGPNVQKLNALDAVVAHKPKVVVAQWVTHLYKQSRHEAGGNMWGVNEERIIKSCEEYIFIGNEQVHAGKSIWNLPHEIIYPDWLYSRAANGSRNFIACWKNPNS